MHTTQLNFLKLSSDTFSQALNLTIRKHNGNVFSEDEAEDFLIELGNAQQTVLIMEQGNLCTEVEVSEVRVAATTHAWSVCDRQDLTCYCAKCNI